IEVGMPTIWSEIFVGGIGNIGVMLYDADKVKEAASVENEKDLYESQLTVFLDPNDPEVAAEAKKQGIPEEGIKAAQQSPIHK
ncbi:nitrate reductase, partial [Bacillus anthracis]|nr:nitrate reductase [Bacillus anthracis]